MNKELKHFGIVGMRWGSRKGISAKKATRKKIASMSDDELRTKLNRINMERQYTALMQTRSSKAKSYVTKIAATSFAAAATAIATKRIKEAMESALD